MKSRFIKSVLLVLLSVACIFLAACDATSENDTPSTTTAVTTAATTVVTTVLEIPDETPDENPDEIVVVPNPVIKSVTRQDNTRTVIMWDYKEGCTYKIYRSGSLDGDYYLIGNSDVGSYLDPTSVMYGPYYYKIEEIKSGETTGKFSDVAKTGFNAQNVTQVHVIMYHNVISDADIANGASFDGFYTIKYEEFRSDLIWLRDNGYNTITSKDLWLYMNGETTLPEKPVILSFDDGHNSIYRNVWPLLRGFGMKADFNVICANIDHATAAVNAGSNSMSRPCTWDELEEMEKSGVINVCSHSYDLHKNLEDGRLGVMINDDESEEDYIEAMTEDYQKVLDSLGKIKEDPIYTFVYPGSVRSRVTDRVFESVGYQILMAGPKARGTNANYFVDGCDFETQYILMSRPCRYHNKPISGYIAANDSGDAALGIEN